MNQFMGQRIRLNGNQLAFKIADTIKSKVQNFIQTNQPHFSKPIPRPKLQIINIGHNIGSLSYIRKKMQTAKQLGFNYHLHQYNILLQPQTYLQQYSEVNSILKHMNPNNFTKYQLNLQELSRVTDIQQSHNLKQQILSKNVQPLIQQINQDQSTSALFIQLPLPQTLRPFTQTLVNTISPLKDADCLTCKNRMQVLDHKSIPELLPCTPRGVLKILDEYKIEIECMNAVMIGRSDLVGKPLSHLLLNKSATTTVCHKFTRDVNFFTKTADLVVSAAGVANLVKQVKEGAILIDVGISRDSEGKLSGDISHVCKMKSSFYTPFPGGVGPMTVVMLMQNVYHLWKNQITTEIVQSKNQ